MSYGQKLRSSGLKTPARSMKHRQNILLLLSGVPKKSISRVIGGGSFRPGKTSRWVKKNVGGGGEWGGGRNLSIP